MLIFMGVMFIAFALWSVKQLTIGEKVPFWGTFFLMVFIVASVIVKSNNVFSMESILSLAFVVILIVIGIVDAYTKTIADMTIYILFAVTVGAVLLIHRTEWQSYLLGAIWGGGFYGAIYVLAKLIYKREAFGFGDVLLMLGIGGYFKLFESIIVSFLAFYIGLALIILGKILGKKRKLSDEIPFGPFMIIATLLMFFWGEEIIQFCFSWIR